MKPLLHHIEKAESTFETVTTGTIMLQIKEDFDDYVKKGT